MAVVSVTDLIRLFRPLNREEIDRAEALIPVVEAAIQVEADKVGKDLEGLLRDAGFREVFKSVVVDVVARMLMTSTNQEPMVQSSESALGYSWSGTFLVPGGGLFIKKAELARLGLRRQKYGVIDYYGDED